MSDPTEQSAITPEMAARILDANWRNLVKRVAAGRTLNATELALIRAKAAGGHGTVTHAKDVTELARILGVSRPTLYAWRRRDGAPKAIPGEGHDVLAWREFISANGLKAGLSPDAEVLKARKLLAEIEDRELKVALRKGQYVLKTEVESEWHRRMAVLKNLLYAKLTMELPPLCAGKDAIEILQLNRDALDAALTEAAQSP